LSEGLAPLKYQMIWVFNWTILHGLLNADYDMLTKIYFTKQSY